MRTQAHLDLAASTQAAQEAAVAAVRAANQAEHRRTHPSGAADFALLRADVQAWFRQVPPLGSQSSCCMDGSPTCSAQHACSTL